MINSNKEFENSNKDIGSYTNSKDDLKSKKVEDFHPLNTLTQNNKSFEDEGLNASKNKIENLNDQKKDMN